MSEKKNGSCYAFGWLPDFPDIRDFRADTRELPRKLRNLNQVDPPLAMLKKAGVADAARARVPAAVDLRQWCPPIEDQGELGSCTAHAGVGLVEFFERKAFGRHIDASRLFLYKTTRTFAHLKGDSGAYLRSTMAALVLFGVPPEEYWPYAVKRFDAEPGAFCYSFAQNYQALQYIRLDPAGTSTGDLLKRIKANLAASLPSIFGFTVYDSISQADKAEGRIPFPGARERVLGGHAVMAVGYDDKLKITNGSSKKATTGAILIRNSWGEGWGEGGYGWLPYEYVLQGLADDWWTMLKNEWIDTGEFKIG